MLESKLDANICYVLKICTGVNFAKWVADVW